MPRDTVTVPREVFIGLANALDGLRPLPLVIDGIVKGLIEQARKALANSDAMTASSDPEGGARGETWLHNRVFALTAALRLHDDYMSEQFSGPDSDALHPKAAANWRYIREVLANATKSAPALAASHNTGERDPSVMPDCPGADTKSDGGCNCSWGCVEADNCLRKLGPLPDWKQDQSETSRIKPRPSDPSPGPDVKPAPIADSSEAGTSGVDLEKRVADLMWAIGAKDKQILELSAALSAPVGEPVAWQYRLFANGYWLGWCICSKTQARHYRGQRDVEIRPLYTHPPAPAVGPDVREALGESSQTLEYLRREARTWGKIFSVNVDHVLDKNRKALSALTRPLGGFVQGSIATKQSTDPEGSSRTETAGANVRLFVECARCGGAGFSSPGTGYDNVCSECGGLRFIPFEAAGKRPVPSVSGNIHREQQRNTMGVTAGETAPNAVADTDANAPGDTSLVSGASAEPNHQPHAVSQGWRDDMENAPRDGTPFLCFHPDDVFSAQTGIDLIWYEPSIKTYTMDGDNEVPFAGITHWMPLPAPPSPAKTGGNRG